MLLLTLLLFTWQYTAFNPADRGSIRSGDIDSQYYSLARWMSVRVAQGELPLWNRDIFGGSPFLAEPQAAALYPPRWTTLAIGILLNSANGLPFWLFEVEIFAHLWLAALLTYGFLRRLALSRSAAFLGAVIFTYSGPLITYPLEQVSILEAAVWVPGVLWGIEAGLGGRRRGWVGAALCLALSFLAGSTQMTVYIGYATLAYVLWRGRQVGVSWRVLSLSLAGWLGLSALLVLAQAVPTIELTLRSPRVGSTFAAVNNGLGFPDLLELFLPHATTIHAALYVGLLPLALALIPVISYRQQGQAQAKKGIVTTPFWVGMVLVALLFSFGGDSAFFGWFYQFLPGIALFRSQERVLFLVAFAIATLAAFGIELLLHKPYRRRYHLVSLTDTPLPPWHKRRNGKRAMGKAKRVLPFRLTPYPLPLTLAKGMWVASAALLTGTLYAYFTGHPTLPGWGFALLMAMSAAGVLSLYGTLTPRQWAGIALLVVMVDLFTIHGRTAWQLKLPEEHEEVPGLVESLPRDPHTTLLDVVSGVQPNIGAFLTVPAVSGASPLRLALYNRFLEALPRSRSWALWGVTHVATPQATLEVPSTVVGESTVNDTPHYLHQLNAPTPRAEVRYDYQVVPSPEEQFALLASATPALLLEGEPPQMISAGGSGAVTRLAIGHESWEIGITTDQPALLRLSLPSYPGWQATVDGVAVPLLRADGLWSAVAVPTGTHTVVLRFVPVGWLVAAVVSAVAWGLAGVLMLGNLGMRRGSPR